LPLRAADAQPVARRETTRLTHALGGLDAALRLTAVAQRTPKRSPHGGGQLGYRMGADVTFPTGRVERAMGTVFVYLRAGAGLNL